MNGFDRTGRGIGNVNEIFLEVLRFSIENQALRVYPGQSSIFAGRMDRHGFSSVELQRVHLPGHVLRDAINDFRAGVRSEERRVGKEGRAGLGRWCLWWWVV